MRNTGISSILVVINIFFYKSFLQIASYRSSHIAQSHYCSSTQLRDGFRRSYHPLSQGWECCSSTDLQITSNQMSCKDWAECSPIERMLCTRNWFKHAITLFVIPMKPLPITQETGKIQAVSTDVRLFDTGHIIRTKTMTTALVLIIPRLAPAKSITQPTRRNNPLLEGSWPSGVSTLFVLASTRSQRLKAVTTSSLVCMSTSTKHQMWLCMILLVSSVTTQCLESLNSSKIPCL